MEDQTHLVQVYMEVLLEAGLSVEEVLKRGLDYLEKYIYVLLPDVNNVEFLIAKILLQAAKNLHIDAESQREAYSQAYTRALHPIEFKKDYRQG